MMKNRRYSNKILAAITAAALIILFLFAFRNPYVISNSVKKVISGVSDGRLNVQKVPASSRVSSGANTGQACLSGTVKCPDGICRRQCTEDEPLNNEGCCLGAEPDYEKCHNDIDDDCDGFCDSPDSDGLCLDTKIGQRRQMSPDPDCCPDDYNPCTVNAIWTNGQCINLPVSGCEACGNFMDCFDGDDSTQDICVGGRCLNQ